MIKVGDAIGLGIGYAALLWWQKRHPAAPAPVNGDELDLTWTEVGELVETANLCFPNLDPSCGPQVPEAPIVEVAFGQPTEPIEELEAFTPYTPPENGLSDLVELAEFEYVLPDTSGLSEFVKWGQETGGVKAWWT